MKLPKWPVVPLGQIAEFRNGLNYNKSNFGMGLKVINVKDFQDRLIAAFSGLEEINPHGLVRDESLIRDGDILFVRSNGNRELIGRSMLVMGVAEPISHSAFSIKARFTDPDTLPRFYAYLFRTALIRSELSNRGGGTNISNLNQDILNTLPVPKPPLPTQRKIAGVLSAYDDLIENNTRRIAILEEMAQAIYREWFVHFRFPGHESARFTDSPLGKIPEGWKVETVKTLVMRMKTNGHYTQNDVASAGSVPVIDQSTAELLGYHDNEPDLDARPESPVIIFGDHTCKMEIVITPFSIGPNVVPFRSATSHSVHYLYWLVNSLVETKEYKRHWSELTNKEVLVCSDAVSDRFTQATTPLIEAMNTYRRQSRSLRKSRDLLLPKLISGQLDVEDLDIDAGELPTERLV